MKVRDLRELIPFDSHVIIRNVDTFECLYAGKDASIPQNIFNMPVSSIYPFGFKALVFYVSFKDRS